MVDFSDLKQFYSMLSFTEAVKPTRGEPRSA